MEKVILFSNTFVLLLYDTHNATQPVWQVMTFRSRVDDKILICAPLSTMFALLPSQQAEDVYETEYIHKHKIYLIMKFADVWLTQLRWASL